MSEPNGPYSLSDMQARIADELARDDLTSQIAIAINDAISAYQEERFLFNEGIFTFLTVNNQEWYDENTTTTTIKGFKGATVTNAIPQLNKIDYAFLYNAGPTPWELDSREPKYMEWASQSGTFIGQPYEFTLYSQEIRLFPIPNAVYTIRMAGSLSFPIPTDANDTTSPWMNAAERLIRCRAKFELAMHVLKDSQMAGDMDRVLTEAYKQLKARTNELTKMGSGYVQAMEF